MLSLWHDIDFENWTLINANKMVSQEIMLERGEKSVDLLNVYLVL